jgi:hypothetical protein
VWDPISIPACAVVLPTLERNQRLQVRILQLKELEAKSTGEAGVLTSARSGTRAPSFLDTGPPFLVGLA